MRRDCHGDMARSSTAVLEQPPKHGYLTRAASAVKFGSRASSSFDSDATGNHDPCHLLELSSVHHYTGRPLPKNRMDTRLKKGHALGNIIFSASVNGNKYRFKCTKDCVGGRGLRVVDRVGKGVALARGKGTLINIDEIDQQSASARFAVFDSRHKCLVLDPPTTTYPANLVNTSTGNARNNCRITHKAGSSYFTVITSRMLQPGEEVLAAYGSTFTNKVRTAALAEMEQLKLMRAVNCNSKLQCKLCKAFIRKRLFKYHSPLTCLQRRRQSATCTAGIPTSGLATETGPMTRSRTK